MPIEYRALSDLQSLNIHPRATRQKIHRHLADYLDRFQADVRPPLNRLRNFVSLFKDPPEFAD